VKLRTGFVERNPINDVNTLWLLNWDSQVSWSCASAGKTFRRYVNIGIAQSRASDKEWHSIGAMPVEKAFALASALLVKSPNPYLPVSPVQTSRAHVAWKPWFGPCSTVFETLRIMKRGVERLKSAVALVEGTVQGRMVHADSLAREVVEIRGSDCGRKVAWPSSGQFAEGNREDRANAKQALRCL
jgi:hypothetical protein